MARGALRGVGEKSRTCRRWRRRRSPGSQRLSLAIWRLEAPKGRVGLLWRRRCARDKMILSSNVDMTFRTILCDKSSVFFTKLTLLYPRSLLVQLEVILWFGAPLPALAIGNQLSH